MNKSGFMLHTDKHYYIMLTNKRKLTIYMIYLFIGKLVDNFEIDQNTAQTILNNRKQYAEIRRKINRCIIGANEIYNIDTGKITRNYSADQVIIFEENKLDIFKGV